MPSGLTDAETKTSIGSSAGREAAVSWSSRRGPKSSPASSHVASTVTGSQSRDAIRAPARRSKKSPPASRYPADCHR
jgi:hypothetical protein